MSAINEYKEKEVKVTLYFCTGQIWVKTIKQRDLEEYLKALNKLKEFGALIDYKIEE